MRIGYRPLLLSASGSLALPFIGAIALNAHAATHEPHRDAISASVSAPGEGRSQDAASDKFGSIAFTKYTLENGLEVLLHQDHALPLVAVNVWFHVGPSNEPPGRSGFAHLFEHLMFEGSKHVGPNFDRYLEGVGATNSNGTTSWDRTNYFETVPSEHLPLLLWLESDRMGFLRDTITQERLDIQRDVVKNERRQSYENAPYGRSTLALLDTLHPVGHPYHGAVIGSMEDLTAATLNDVRDFADKYYAPSNATLCIAGDFDEATVRAQVEKYFGPLRKVPKPSAAISEPTRQPSASRLVVNEPVEVGKVAFGWIAPPAFSAAHATLTVLATLLADGKSTRLYRNLVVDQRIAVDVDADVDDNALETMFLVDAMASKGIALETLEQRLSEQLQQLEKLPPTSAELERAKKKLKLRFSSELELLNGPGGETGRSGLLQRFNHYLGDPSKIAEWHARLQNVTSSDIVAASTKYLQPSSRITVITEPKKAEASRP